MQERHTDRERYFNEQAWTTEKYYLPYIKGFLGKMPDSVLEVGCGEGGNLLPFAIAGANVTGVDLAARKIENARSFFAERRVDGTFISKDIFQLTELKGTFQLIIVHDVIEHIYDKELFLNGLKDYLAPEGCMFVAFPSWQMPFGGHQQIARSRVVSHFPFIHLLPKSLYKVTLKLFGESDSMIEDLLDIKHTKCPIERFHKAVKSTGYIIEDSRFYFINPNYEVKFGLKPRKLWSVIAAIPWVRNFFCTSSFHILRPNHV